MFKVSNNVTTTTFIVNFEYISYLFTPFSSVFTVGFDQLNVCWVLQVLTDTQKS